MRAGILVAGLAAVGVYWFIGKPGMADAPLGARLVELEELARTSPEDIDGAQFMAILTERARKNPEDPAPHKLMGDVQVAVGRADEARLSYLASLRRDPNYTPAKDALSELSFLLSGEVDAATVARLPEIRDRARANPGALTAVQFVALLEERIADVPDDPVAHKMLGDIYRNAGFEERAVDAYAEAVRLNPDFQEALKLLGDTRFRLSGAVDAETTEIYRKAFKADPADLRLGYMAGIGDWQAGRRAEAEAAWDRLEAQVQPGDPRGQMFKALRETFAVE